jgi:glycosyltransferase involved in cell wall biosynthesis
VDKNPEATPHVLVDARFAPKRRGGDRCRYELAAYLARQERPRTSFLVYAHAEPIVRDWNPGAKMLLAPWTPDRHPQADWFEHITLPRKAQELQTDLYHGTFQVLPLRAPAPMTVLTVHDMATFSHPEAYSARFVKYMRPLLRASIRRSTHIIAITEATKQEILRYCPDAEPKITVILNGVGREFLNAADIPPETVQATCRNLKLPQPFVLFVGSLEAKKNHVRLIEAFRRIKKETGLPHTLVIVGERLDSVPDGGVSEAEADKTIHFTGYVPDADLPTLYRGADLVAYPSLYEGFGMPVLEGMAASVPVLTSNVSSLPEVAGGAAMLVDPLDVEDIARGLHRTLTDRNWREFAIHAGHKRALSLTWEENGRRTVALYTKLWEERYRRAA